MHVGILYNRGMQSKQSKFIFMSLIGILIVIGLGVFMNKASNKPSKYDGFAQALKTEGAQFYGAFWCPHCQAQKAEFGTSKKYLPYYECSNADRSPTPICIDKKVESFPTWMFKDGVTLTSKSTPIICAVKPGVKDEPSICSAVSSEYARVWVFPEYKFSVKSVVDPIKVGDIWKFPVDAQTTGEVPLEFLASQIHYTLPQ
jgi:thiol-disulfide isomerase/thioredoxin